MIRTNAQVLSLSFALALLPALAGPAAGASLAPANAAGEYRYLVELEGPGLLQAQERQPGEPFDPDAPDVLAHRETLRAQHLALLQAMSDALARQPLVTHHYQVTHSGMAVWLTPAEAEIVAELPGVVAVERERVERLATYRGPTFIGADRIWDGSAVPGGAGTRGEGAVVGVLDTGIDPEHPSFANDSSCGHGAADVPDKLISAVDCATTDLDGRCNGPLPHDTNSHGSHVASTAAGNRLDSSADPPPEPFEEISGVAPCAHVRAYKVCPDIACDGSMIQAGMQNILLDGDVDVMNFSITGGRNPWNDNDRTKLDLVGAGVLVAAAAGNTGPTLTDPVGQVNHLGPWVFTIAASTHDGLGQSLPVVSASGPGVPPDDTQRLVMIKGSSDVGEVPDGEPFTDKPIRRFVDPLGETAEGCTPFPPGFFDGAVALIKRGTCTFAQKVTNAELAGAEMVIIRNDVPGALSAWGAGAPSGPAYSLSLADGEAMAGWIAQHPDAATVDFDFVPGQGQGDVLANFSLLGPTPAPFQDLTKPDSAAPGVSIFAAEPGLAIVPGGYGYKSGTSMATPHAAGAAALIRAVHPDWTVSEVKSALMTTAFEEGTKPDETTPWEPDDVGSGRVDLGRAALAGLVMDETFDAYLAASPASGGDPKTLNLPSMRDMDCTPSCAWTRTVRNTLAQPTTWSASGSGDGMVVEVTPISFSFAGDPAESQQITITATPVGDQTASVVFGDVVLTETSDLAPEQHLTVALRGTGDGGGDPPVVTTIDDADPAIEYRKGWHRRDDTAASDAGYHRRMGSPGGGDPPTARLVFDGDEITYFFARSEHGGTADVLLDGALAATVDFSGPAPGNAPEFGHEVTFGGLGEAAHELLIVHRSGAVYVDGFEIVSTADGGADASAAGTRSSTTTAHGELTGLGDVLIETIEVGAADEWLSVVVEGAAQLQVQLFDPLGSLAGQGGELIAGAAAVGVDLAPLMAGLYTIQVLDPSGGAVTVEVSVSRTETVP